MALMNERQLSILQDELSVASAIETIKKFECEQSLAGSESTVYLKDYKTQAVIQTDNYVYKLYQGKTDKEGPFFSRVRNCLGKVYQEMGIHWSIASFSRDGSLFDFEQRERLHVASPEDVSFTEIMLSMSDVYDEVEEMMQFDKIFLQLKEYPEFRNVNKLQLNRACVNSFEDYALFGSHAILLDDAEFYVAAIDEEGNPQAIDPTFEANIKTDYGEFTFRNMVCETDHMTGKKRVLDFVNDIFRGWLLYVDEEENSRIVLHDVDDSKSMAMGKDLQRALVKEETSVLARIVEIGEL